MNYKRFLNLFLRKYLEFLEKINKTFLTLHSRPQKAENYNLFSDELKNFPRAAIVIQGPLIKDNNFTLETIRIYKKLFPNCTILLSTWNTEDEEYLKRISKEHIEIILSDEPQYPGTSHRNYQIKSSLAGIKRAQKINAEYVLKTRTDQRINAVNGIEFLYNMLMVFPVAHGYKQNRRIIGVSLNSYKYRPYGISDMNLFGQIDDMLLYWERKPDMSPKYAGEKMKVGEFIKAGFCNEVDLSSNYLKKIGRELKWTVRDSWQAMADHFCIVDQHSLDLYWHKYDRQKEYKYLDYNHIRNSQEFSFREWLNIYCQHNNRPSSQEGSLNLMWRGILKK